VQKNNDFGKDRLEALTDGIFAFALTLLVLNIDVPPTVSQDAPAAAVENLLGSLAPHFLHYVLAFLILASFWVTHHQFFRRITVMDKSLMWLSIIGLLLIALLPFSTDLASTFDRYSLAAIFFEANVFFVGIIFFAQWAYASKGSRLLERGTGPEEIQLEKRRLLVMPLVSLAALLPASAGIPGTTMIYLFTPFIYLWLGRE